MYRLLEVKIITQIINTHPINSYSLHINEPIPIDLLLPSFHEFTFLHHEYNQNQNQNHHYVMNSNLLLDEQINFKWNISPSVCSLSSNLSHICNKRSEYSRLSSLHITNITIPPNSIFTFIFPYKKRFLSRSYQPTDASRGGDIPSAIIFYHQKSQLLFLEQDIVWNIYITPSWTITTFFPDASMPFNVIIMVYLLNLLLLLLIYFYFIFILNLINLF